MFWKWFLNYITCGRLIIRIGFAVQKILGFEIACCINGGENTIFLLREIPLRALRGNAFRSCSKRKIPSCSIFQDLQYIFVLECTNQKQKMRIFTLTTTGYYWLLLTIITQNNWSAISLYAMYRSIGICVDALQWNSWYILR